MGSRMTVAVVGSNKVVPMVLDDDMPYEGPALTPAQQQAVAALVQRVLFNVVGVPYAVANGSSPHNDMQALEDAAYKAVAQMVDELIDCGHGEAHWRTLCETACCLRGTAGGSTFLGKLAMAKLALSFGYNALTHFRAAHA